MKYRIAAASREFLGDWKIDGHWREAPGNRVAARIDGGATAWGNLWTIVDDDRAQIFSYAEHGQITLYDGPFPLTKQAVMESFAKLVQESLAE